MVFLTFITAVGKVIIPWLSEKITVQLLRNVRKQSIEKLLSFDIGYFSEAESGKLLFLMTSETSRFSGLVSVALNSVTYIIQLAIFVLMLLYLFWELTIIIIFIGVIYFLLHLNIDYRIKEKSWKVNLIQNNLAHFFHEIIYGIRIIKIGALEEREKNRYIDEHLEYEQQSIKFSIVRGLSGFSQEILLASVLLIIMYSMVIMGDSQIIDNSPDQFLGFLFLLVRTLPVAVNLQSSRNNFISFYGPLSRVMNLLDQPSSQQNHMDGGKKDVDGYITKIDVNNVYFNYKDNHVLKGVSCSFHVGKRTAIVGGSGSGKSTLLDLLSSLQKPVRGDILINGEKLNEIKESQYKSKLGYMNQEPIVFHDTVKNNITYLNPDATNDEINESLIMADAYQFTNSFPNGLDQGIGERGQTLSGGQKQRVGLARIFLQKADIILLDEATNALDYETEKNIYDNIKRISDRHIVVVVAHRLSAVQDFENIIMLEKGVIVEQGTHDELMMNKSYYSSLYNAQKNII